MPQRPGHTALKSSFIELSSVDSTNNYARQLVNDGLACHGLGIFTHEQFAGKGQRGKEWLSQKNENLLLSVILDPNPLPVSQQFQLNATMAVAALNFFIKYAGDQARIKWPNDIYWQDRKAGGILIESMGNWKWAIVGIGININQTRFPQQLVNPVSLKQITGNSYDPVTMARELREEITRHFEQLKKDGFGPFHHIYSSRLYKKNEWVKFKRGEEIFGARVLEITTNGELIIQHEKEEMIRYGEAEWLSP